MSRGDPGRDAATRATRPRRVNWPLWLGSALIMAVVFLAVAGPSLAPNDPREHHLIIQVDGKWLKPPYPAFTPGYPLGSDTLGRDLFSWLLWSVRPTIILVVVVAAVRMVLGIVVGIGAGWSDRFLGRLCDGLITAALSVPTLIAALIVITAVGFRFGVWSFVAGLTVTGWAETAQLVRERTRTVKAQEAVEAARALGASGAQIVVLHILPQVMPMIWMLLAFEVSHAVVTTAGLGFLGYYLGGPIFAEVDDFVYRRISEMPELGQMLATVWMVLDEPWAMVAAGSVVFLIVLAFNLVGEGLQARLTRTLGGSRGLYLRAAGDWIPRVEDAAGLVRRHWGRVAIMGLVLVAAGVSAVSWQARRGPDAGVGIPAPATGVGAPAGADESAAAAVGGAARWLEVPGGHIWANEGHDPWRTRCVGFSGPVTTTVQWSAEVDGAFVGGPVVDAQGVIYQAASALAESGERSGRLYAFGDDGRVWWEAALPAPPTGTPALAGDATIYVVIDGGLVAVTPDGQVRWQFASDDAGAAGGALVGPSGDVYYKSPGSLVAVHPDGSLGWKTPITGTVMVDTPRVSADGQTVYWRNLAFDAADGSPTSAGLGLAPQGIPLVQAVVACDGQLYWQYDVWLLRDVGEGVTLEEATVVNWEAYTWEGLDAGISADGRPWLIARPTTVGMGRGFYWGTAEGELSSKLSVPYADSGQVVGVDAGNIAYFCSNSFDTAPSCVAFGPEQNRAIWRIQFRRNGNFTGAALAPGRLYAAFDDGTLIALGDPL